MICIREAKQSDSEAVARVGNSYSNETIMGGLNSEDMNRILVECFRTGAIFVAENDGEIVGVLAGRFIKGMGGLGKLFEEIAWYVLPEHRGIGLMLFDRMMQKCREEKCEGIVMSAYQNNYLSAVERLYKKNGFFEVERTYFKKL